MRFIDSFFFKSIAIDFFPLLAISVLDFCPADSNLSITITSAPKSAKTIPQKGPGPKAENSITFIPFRGPISIHSS